jgi:hypothetical protein
MLMLHPAAGGRAAIVTATPASRATESALLPPVRRHQWELSEVEQARHRPLLWEDNNMVTRRAAVWGARWTDLRRMKSIGCRISNTASALISKREAS